MEIIIGIIGVVVSILSLFNRTERLLGEIRDILKQIRDALQ